MARYKPNYREVGRFLRHDPDLRSALRPIANRIATRAKVLAPVRTGKYKDSIDVREATWAPLRRPYAKRMAYDVIVGVEYATVVELGHRNVRGRETEDVTDQRGRREVRGRHVLRRAAEGS